MAMASRLLGRSSGSAPRTVAQSLRSLPSLATRPSLDHNPLPQSSDPRSPAPDPPSAVRSPISSLLGSRKIWCYDHMSASDPYKFSEVGLQSIPRWFSVKAQGRYMVHEANKVCSDASTEKDNIVMKPEVPRVALFSPLEATVKARPSGLVAESLKIKRMELSQKLTYALIPALLLVSKTKWTTSVILLSVFWQIYGFFKEIFLDYVHQEVTRTWVLIYFKLLLLIVAKDLFLNFDLL